MRGPKGTSKARSSPPERELRSDRGRRGERPGSTFRKGTRTTALGDRAARHAAKPPESLDEEDLAKGRPSEPDRRERAPRESVARGSRGARETDASSHRARSARANPVHRTPRRVHVVVRRLQAPSTKHRALRFCGWCARRRSRSSRRSCSRDREPSRSRCEAENRSEQVRLEASPPSGGIERSQARGSRGRGPLNKVHGRVSPPFEGMLRIRHSAETRERDFERSTARQRWSSCRCPPAGMAQGRTMPPAAFPSNGSLCILPEGSRSHPSENEGDSSWSSRANVTLVRDTTQTR